ncbi:MAG: DUF2892 domain-containing protein [Clostridiales bacterium]|nr:DUF2892 domain-containing protein [Clostridiales bacterium]
MEKNVGTLDANARLFIGFSLLGIGIIKSSKLLTSLGAAKIAIGISKFCPMLYALKLSTVDQDEYLGKFLKKVPEFAEKAAEDLGLEHTAEKVTESLGLDPK